MAYIERSQSILYFFMLTRVLPDELPLNGPSLFVKVPIRKLAVPQRVMQEVYAKIKLHISDNLLM